MYRVSVGFFAAVLLGLSSFGYCQDARDVKDVSDQIAIAEQLYRTKKYPDAIREFKKAAKMSNNRSHLALLGLAQSYRAVAASKDCSHTALLAANAGTTDRERSDGHWVAGLCLVQQGADKKDKYVEGEKELRTALQLAPDNHDIHVSLGLALLKQSRDAEGTAEMKLYLAKQPTGSMAQAAARYIENPRRAREIFVPEFSLTTLDGSYISTDDLQGKVLVLDFWATWCGPCKAALGDLRSLAKKYSEKPVVVLSISADRDKDAWMTFVEKEKMKWPQYFDGDGRICRLFGVHVFPSYLIVDGDGVVQRVVTGSGGFQMATIEGAINRALKQLPEQNKN